MRNIEEAKRRIRKCIENQETELDLRHLHLTNLEKEVPELKECTHLIELNLYEDILSDSYMRSMLVKKNIVYFNDFRLNTLKGIESLKNLEKLSVDGFLINDLNPLAGLKKITTLNLVSTEIGDLKILRELTNLTTLRLESKMISDLSMLSELKNIENLFLSVNQINDFSFLSNLIHLKDLKIYNSNISDISSLPNLIKLNALELVNNQITDIEPITRLVNLQTLNLDYNQISTIEQLSNLKNIKKLSLKNNKVTDISSISSLEKIQILSLSDNEINDIEAISSLLELNELFLDDNQIYDLTPLKGLANLEELRISNNNIDKINELIGLNNLRKLDVSNNLISNFQPLLSINKYNQNDFGEIDVEGNPIFWDLGDAIMEGYKSLKHYYDTLDAEGSIQNDQLKVILLGNSTAGKTSVLKYWGNKTFNLSQTTTHGIYTPIELPLNYEAEEGTFRINVWDFGGQDYYHATHRLFVTRDSTYILVCNQNLENKPEQELTTEFIEENNEIKEVQVPVQHYPYRYWLQTLAFLTKSGKIDDRKNIELNKSKLLKLFLIENKCGTYQHKDYLKLDKNLKETLPFEVINQDFYQLDIKEAWRYATLNQTDRIARRFHDNFEEFEEQLKAVLQAQIKENRYEVHKNYPIIRDILASMAACMQNTNVPDELNQYLVENKIAPIESYDKLPVWITYSQYEDIVRKNSKSAEPHWESLHIYLQNLCGRIFHFKYIPSLADIVFIDPNWLHKTIYKVLSQQVLENNGEFTLSEADSVIDGNIIEAATFMEVMMAFDLIFEIPEQNPRRFVAPQYLPKEYPFSAQQLKKCKEVYHELAMTLEFLYYLPPSLISRIIAQKGKFIKDADELLWRNGLMYVENGVSVFVLCEPKDCKIEINIGKNTDNELKKRTLRDFMALFESRFSDEIENVQISLPDFSRNIRWKDLYYGKKGNINRVIAKDRYIDLEPFLFLIQEFERKPLNVFVCYSHKDSEEMKSFTDKLKEHLRLFEKDNKVKFNTFTDLQLQIGDLWHEVLKANIKKTDILICLLSPTFFTSDYIQEHEYGQKMKEIAVGNSKAVILPRLFFKLCQVKF